MAGVGAIDLGDRGLIGRHLGIVDGVDDDRLGAPGVAAVFAQVGEDVTDGPRFLAIDGVRERTLGEVEHRLAGGVEGAGDRAVALDIVVDGLPGAAEGRGGLGAEAAGLGQGAGHLGCCVTGTVHESVTSCSTILGCVG